MEVFHFGLFPLFRNFLAYLLVLLPMLELALLRTIQCIVASTTLIMFCFATSPPDSSCVPQLMHANENKAFFLVCAIFHHLPYQWYLMKHQNLVENQMKSNLPVRILKGSECGFHSAFYCQPRKIIVMLLLRDSQVVWCTAPQYLDY